MTVGDENAGEGIANSDHPEDRERRPGDTPEPLSVRAESGRDHVPRARQIVHFTG